MNEQDEAMLHKLAMMKQQRFNETIKQSMYTVSNNILFFQNTPLNLIGFRRSKGSLGVMQIRVCYDGQYTIRKRFTNIPAFGPVVRLNDEFLNYRNYYREKMRPVFTNENPDIVMKQFKKLLAKKTNQSLEQILHQ